MNNVIWYSTNKDLSNKNEGRVDTPEKAEEIVDRYEANWKNIGQYVATEEYQKGEGMDILSQTSFYFYSDTDSSKLDINMGEKYQIVFETKKSDSPLLAWMKYKRRYKTTSLSKLKEIVAKFIELDREAFKKYFTF